MSRTPISLRLWLGFPVRDSELQNLPQAAFADAPTEGVPGNSSYERKFNVLINSGLRPDSERKPAKRLCEEEEGLRSDTKFSPIGGNGASAVWPDDMARWSSG